MQSKINNVITINEDFLWNRMKDGDDESFSQIFKYYYSQLYSYGIKLVSSPDFVHDQIQDLFVNIWQNREGLGEVTNLKAYLFVALRRRLFRAKKSKLAIDPIEENLESDTEALVFEPGEFMDKEYISTKLKETLIENLNHLPLNQREIIFLRFFHQLTYHEIADIVCLKEQSVKNMMPKILSKLSKGIDSFSKDDIDDIDIMLFNLFLLFQKN